LCYSWFRIKKIYYIVKTSILKKKKTPLDLSVVFQLKWKFCFNNLYKPRFAYWEST